MAIGNPCQPLLQLEAGLGQLEVAFLPSVRKIAPDTYTDHELTSAKAYLVFAHAELEDYLEALCRSKAQRALEKLISSGTVCITALSLVSHFGNGQGITADIAKYGERNNSLAPDFPIHDPKVTRSILSRLKDSVGMYMEQCRKNNGVKEANLLQLLLPLGINPLEMDSAWIAEINAFGVDRGAHAHRGLSGVQQIADPFLSHDRMKRILDGPPGSIPPTGSSILVYSLRSLDALLAA